MPRSDKIVDARHCFEEDGSLPTEAASRRAAIRIAQCIEAGGTLARGHARPVLVPCRCRPGGVACLGLLWVLKQKDDAILAFCPECDANEAVIYEWEHTLWALGPVAPVDVAASAKERGGSTERMPKPGDETARLERALQLLGSSMSAAQVRELVATAEHPSAVLQAVVDSTQRPPDRLALERFMPVLVDLWNTTPRPELGGRSPEDVEEASVPVRAEPKIGRNPPCPCGSGKKYKKCCLGAGLH